VQCNEEVVVEFSPHCDLVRFVIPSHFCQLKHYTWIATFSSLWCSWNSWCVWQWET